LVALDPSTGAILALATSPTFDPRRLHTRWDTLVKDSRKPLLQRALQEHYPPGSTMKLVTAAAALAHDIPASTTYACDGSVRKYGVQITDYSGHRHSAIAMPMAMRVSCNNYFAQLAAEMPEEVFFATAGQFGFGHSWWKDTGVLRDPRILPIPMASSSLMPSGHASASKGERAHMGFGQSTVVATPLQMAMVAAGIANNGTVVAPYLVSALRKGGTSTVLHQYHSGVIGQPLDTAQARALADMMQDVVAHGTGTNARTRGLTVYGKTGTAQQGGGRDHAWFVGFAEPAGDSSPASRIAFAVLIERGGSTGGAMAAPIARAFLEAWRDQL
jgi:peptidoglycan glycosyltransferase